MHVNISYQPGLPIAASGHFTCPSNIRRILLLGDLATQGQAMKAEIAAIERMKAA
jgi:hypothetical protein